MCRHGGCFLVSPRLTETSVESQSSLDVAEAPPSLGRWVFSSEPRCCLGDFAGTRRYSPPYSTGEGDHFIVTVAFRIRFICEPQDPRWQGLVLILPQCCLAPGLPSLQTPTHWFALISTHRGSFASPSLPSSTPLIGLSWVIISLSLPDTCSWTWDLLLPRITDR